MLVAQTLVWLLGIYVLAGIVFAPLLLGAARIDPSVKQRVIER